MLALMSSRTPWRMSGRRKRRADAGRQLDGRRLLHDPRHEDRELVASQPGEGVAGSQHAPQARGDRRDHLVTRVVAERVVDLAEAVDIHEHDGRLDAVPPGRRDRPLGAVSEQQPVGEARELVVHRLVRGPLRAPADGGRLPAEREPQSAEREHHEPEDGLRGQSRAKERRPRRIDDDVPVVRVPGHTGDPLEDGAPSAGLDGAAGSRPKLRQRGQRGTGAAQRRADSLALTRVEDDVSRPGVDDRDVEAAGLSHDGLAQRLDRDLEVEDGAAHAADGDGGCSGDDPRVRVRRDVRRHLIGLAGRQAERRADEGVCALVGGERRERGGDAVLESCHLAPVRRDEAGLAD